MGDLTFSSTAASAAVRGSAVADVDATELHAIKQLLALLDKTFKTVRTYGPKNPVAQKFFQQFYDYLTLQLGVHDLLQFLVQRGELYYKGQCVYQSTSTTENLAFKLHADGIRELSFHKGLGQEELLYFLEAVWGTHGEVDTVDDDIVTKMWEKNLSTISFVTAEEIVKAADVSAFLTPQDNQTLSATVSDLRTIASRESVRRGEEGAGGSQGPSVATYEISLEEMQGLAAEIVAESSRDSVTYLLDMLTAILASEHSHSLLDRLLDLFHEILGTLIKDGNWKLLNTFVSLLKEAQELCPNLSDSHKSKLSHLFTLLGRSEQLKTIEAALNAAPDATTEDLQALLLMVLGPTSVPTLCTLMANLKHKPHRMMICEILTMHARENPQLLTKGLTDSRWHVVRNLVYVMGQVGDESLLKHLDPLVMHPDSRVRKEVMRTMRTLTKGNNADRFIRFLNDEEESIRLMAVKMLLANDCQAGFDVWAPIVNAPAFHTRSISERKAVFQAMGKTAGEACIPYWRQLIVKRFWRHRRHHEEAAVLAAEALALLPVPGALAALREGQRRFNRAIRRACTKAIAAHTHPAGQGAPTS